MTQAGDTATGGAPGASAMLAFAVAGVLPDGDAAPRLRCRRVGGGYDGVAAVTGRVLAVGHGIELEFSLPGGPLDFILLEPAALPGSYRIARLAWDGETVADLPRRVIAAEQRVECDADTGALCIASERGRPWVEIDVRGLASSGAGSRLGLVLQRDPDGAAAAADIARIGGRLSSEIDLARSGIVRLGREAGSISDRVGDVASGLSALAAGQARLEALQSADGARFDALGQRMAALEAAVGGRAAEQSLAALAARVDSLSAGRVAADATAAAAAADAAAGRDAAARELEAIRHALDGLQAGIDRVTHAVENVFWRRWLRRLRGGGR